ncbi:MAG TPA: sugar phosphate isomerase/epimerase [Thermomicrobiales bacterium]|nr:sugar phosphate isomerase/epimerase [Thermomicrobiales bacterium]
MRLSCPEQMLAEYPSEERLRIIRDSGFDGVDCRYASLEDPAFLEPLHDSGLPLASVYSQIRTPSLLDHEASDRASAVDEVVRRARTAARHGATNLILVPVFGETRLSLDLSESEIVDVETALLIVSLKEISDRLGEASVTVVVEPLNRNETHFLTNPAIAAGICGKVNSPRIATMVDTYHCHQEHLDSPEQIDRVGDHLALVHLSDSGRGLPGEGEVDFQAVLVALAAAGYSGWLGFECRQVTTTDDERALAASVETMRSMSVPA